MLTLSKRYLELEQAAHRGTGGVSSENRHLGFVPAFMDTRTGKVYGCTFADGRPAPFHILDGLPDELVAHLRESAPGRVLVAGIDTDMCVLKIAMDLFDRSIEPIVLTDCCASTSGLQAHLAGLAVLSRNIGADRLREAGLSEGSMAAPPHADGAPTAP